MSRTYDIGCVDCKESLWIGQGWPGHEPDDRYIYTANKWVMEELRKFLYRHEGHHLLFGDDERHFDPDEYNEIEQPEDEE